MLTGGIRYAASDDPYAYSGNGLIRYGINAKGDLIVQTPVRWESAVSGGITDLSTYVAGYINGDANGSASATARIYTIQVSVTFHLLRYYNPAPGWLEQSSERRSAKWQTRIRANPTMQAWTRLCSTSAVMAFATSPLGMDGDARFDINGDGFANPTGWIGADWGFLVHLDTAPNGQVTSVKQLFGSTAVDGSSSSLCSMRTRTA